MENFLACRFAIGKEEIHAFAFYASAAQGIRDSVSNTKYLCAFLLVQTGEVRRMAIGHHQNVTGIDRLNVHERGAGIILIDHADFEVTRNQFADYAVSHLGRPY
jgi:hypothetical protein